MRGVNSSVKYLKADQNAEQGHALVVFKFCTNVHIHINSKKLTQGRDKQRVMTGWEEILKTKTKTMSTDIKRGVEGQY